jgi:hypothetical protein
MNVFRWRISVSGLVLFLIVTGGIQAGGTLTFRVDDFRQVPGLELRGVTVSSGGGLVPGLLVEPLAGPALPVVWKVVAAPDGTVYAAGGDPGTLLRLPAGGPGEILLARDAAGFTALAINSTGHILAGQSPGGRILTLNSQGELQEEIETGSRYIWDLLADGEGGVWVAAGDPGAVYHLAPGGAPRQVLSLGDGAARCLAPGPDESVMVGTAGQGRLFRINRDGTTSVLFAAEEAEIVDLVVAEDGGIVLALSGVSGGPSTAPPGSPPSAAGSSAANGGEPARAGGKVIRLEPDGRYSELWESAGVTPLTLLNGPGGDLWLGVSPGGTLHSIEGPGRERLLASLPVESITHLAPFPDGKVVVATGGLGSVLVLSQGGGRGEIVSAVHDAGAGARFGGASWGLRAGKPGTVKVAFRSGPTARPDQHWNPWSRWHQGKGSVPAPVAPAERYVQWRVRLDAEGPSAAEPELAYMEISYLPRNQAPVVKNAQVLPAGVVLEPLPMPPGQASAPEGSEAAAILAGSNGSSLPPPTMSRVRRLWQPGRRTVVWESEDADGDDLSTRLFLRADGEQEFLPFGEGQGVPFHVFSETRLADGGYVIRVEVSDAPGNPLERSRSVLMDTPRFVVDRTPPVIEKFTWHEDGEDWVFRFAVTDAAGTPRDARLTLDDGVSSAVLPADGIEDSSREVYAIRVPAGHAGTRVAIVEVADDAGNRSVARLLFNPQE